MGATSSTSASRAVFAPRAISAALLLAAAATAQAQCTPGWVSPPIPGMNSQVRSLTAMPNGDVIAGGSFTIAGGVAAPNKVARYSLATGEWSSLGTGTNGSLVYALAVLPGGDVVAGGNFTAIGGVTTRQLARFNFDTQEWSGMNYGTNGGQVNVIMNLPGNELIIGGNIPRVAGMSVDHCARLNLTTGVWTSMNSQMVSSGDIVYAFALAPDGTVIAGGSFLNGGGGSVGALRIGRYHPTTNTWSTLGSGMNNVVRGVVVRPDGDVIAGGYFTTAGGVPANLVARYNPASGTWSPLGTGLSGAFNYVNAVSLLPDGDIVVGGSFTVAGGVGAARVARYSFATGTWSALGSGVNQDVAAQVVQPSGNIVLGGFFTAGIAAYSFGGSTPDVTSSPADVAACMDQSVGFSITASGTSPAYQWRRNAAPISALDNPSAATATLMIAAAQPEDAGSYDCVVTNTCGSDTSDPAILIVNSADFNGDGDIGTDADIEAYFACLGGNCCPTCGTADFNGDGDIGTDADIETFFRVLAGGVC